MKFVLVNGRTPRPQSFCALCCEPIGQSYLREISTRLSYCDHMCYVAATWKAPSFRLVAPFASSLRLGGRS
jgi:hypothetical protein